MAKIMFTEDNKKKGVKGLSYLTKISGIGFCNKFL